MVLPPINFKNWIEDNRELLKPPVCNKVVYEDTEFIIMVVGGPNTRKDYHVDHIRPLAAEISSFVPVSSTEETEHSYVFTLDDVITNESTTAYYMSGARQQGHACTSASYDAILDMGYNRFSTVFYGGRDGLDITEMDPFRNTGLSSGNE